MNYAFFDNKGLSTFCIIIFFSISTKSISQEQNDTLNRFDKKNKKTGLWTFYLDSLFNRCEINKAKFYGYVRYNKGVPEIKSFGRYNKHDSLSYISFFKSDEQKYPIRLNGDLFHYQSFDRTKKIRLHEVYRNGRLTTVTENINWKSMIYPDSYFIYFDSLYERNPGTYLFYAKEKNVMVYKQYRSFLKNKPITEKIYLVKHRDFRKIDRPIIGWHGFFDYSDSTRRNFVELGFSRKYITGSRLDTINVTYKNHRFSYQSLNFSLMASNTNNHFSLGQKFVYAYNLVLLRTEVGLVNYTDFKTTDLAAVFGIGFTVLGYFNEVVYFSIPISTQTSNSYPKISFSIVFN